MPTRTPASPCSLSVFLSYPLTPHPGPRQGCLERPPRLSLSRVAREGVSPPPSAVPCRRACVRASALPYETLLLARPASLCSATPGLPAEPPPPPPSHSCRLSVDFKSGAEHSHEGVSPTHPPSRKRCPYPLLHSLTARTRSSALPDSHPVAFLLIVPASHLPPAAHKALPGHAPLPGFSVENWERAPDASARELARLCRSAGGQRPPRCQKGYG